MIYQLTRSSADLSWDGGASHPAKLNTRPDYYIINYDYTPRHHMTDAWPRSVPLFVVSCKILWSPRKIRNCNHHGSLSSLWLFWRRRRQWNWYHWSIVISDNNAMNGRDFSFPVSVLSIWKLICQRKHPFWGAQSVNREPRLGAAAFLSTLSQGDGQEK